MEEVLACDELSCLYCNLENSGNHQTNCILGKCHRLILYLQSK